MRIDHNHIDDLFKEGLDQFAEVPQQGVWNRISSRLLWREIIRFNFSNVHGLLTGMTLAGILVAAVMFYTTDTGSPEKSISAGQAGEVNKLKPPPENTTSSFIAENQGRSGQERQTDGHAAGLESASEDADPAFESSPVPADETGHPDDHALDEMIRKGLQQANAGPPEEIAASEVSGVTVEGQANREQLPDPRQAENASLMPEGSSEALLPNQLPQQMEAGIPGEEAAAAQQPGISDENANPSSAVQNVGPIGSVMAQQETRVIIPQNEPENVIGYAEGRESIDMINSLDEAQPGDLQKMHSLSFAIGQFFKGKYKAPKRSYQTSTMDMYRGDNGYFSLSAYIAPEITNYTRSMSSSRESSYLGGVALGYHSSRYIIQGALEFSYHNDLGDYMVNMTSWDSVGFYQDITGFEVDPDNPDSVIFHTETVTIYDSVDHQLHQQTHNYYTYLQFPVMIGYKAMESGIFSAYLKAGPNFSFLLTRNEPGLIYTQSDATIQGIDNYTAPRLKTSIQVLLSLSMQLQITEQLGILFEPTYRYYLNPVYDVSGEKLNNPYSIGIRSGLFVNF